MNKIFLIPILLCSMVAGCKSMELQVPGNGVDELEAVEIGSKVVQAVISGNYSDFAAAAGEENDEKSAALFQSSRKELVKNHGKLCSYRHFGKLDTPLFSNLFFAVKFQRQGSDGKSIEHELLMQLLFGRKDDSWQLVGMRFI